MRPILEARAHQAEAMVEDLGGPGAVTALQRGVLDTWLQAQVAADVAFPRFVRGEAPEVPERLLTALNTAPCGARLAGPPPGREESDGPTPATLVGAATLIPTGVS